MGFLPPDLSCRTAFYSARPAAGKKAAGGFFSLPLPSQLGGRRQSGTCWAEDEDLVGIRNAPAQGDTQSLGQQEVEWDARGVAASKES
jgi:hypothetical protein